MKLPLRDERQIDEEAAAWLEALQQGGPEARKAFARWVKESPRHIRAFLLMSALDVELDGVDRDRILQTRIDSARVVSLDQRPLPTPVRKRWPRSTRSFVLAASLAAAAVGVVLAVALLPARYVTSVGEQRTFDLPDGSVVSLNTDSRLALDYSSNAREIRLLTGEALFKVARDKTRPFRVSTEDAIIHAVGTQFNVRSDSHGTKVSVIEGRVKVADRIPLGAGEEATIQRHTGVVHRAAADTTKALAWRQRRLMFRKDTLIDIANEFNRYNQSPQIRIDDESVSTRRFSGVFDADDPESLAQVLEGGDGLEVERTEREILIRGK
jgi:transmembrane sensor